MSHSDKKENNIVPPNSCRIVSLLFSNTTIVVFAPHHKLVMTSLSSPSPGALPLFQRPLSAVAPPFVFFMYLVRRFAFLLRALLSNIDAFTDALAAHPNARRFPPPLRRFLLRFLRILLKYVLLRFLGRFLLLKPLRYFSARNILPKTHVSWPWPFSAVLNSISMGLFKLRRRAEGKLILPTKILAIPLPVGWTVEMGSQCR